MNKCIAYFSLFIPWAITLTTLNQVVLANTVVQVKANQVSGETAQLQTVKVWPGHGVSISFFSTKEIIKKIWLDDPSRFVFDVDGCLEGLGRCSENSGAGLIHIRQIEKVKIRGLPEGPNGAHMTVITEFGSQRKTYHFRIVLGKGTPEYSELEIINDTANKKEEIVRPKVDYTARSDSKYITKGMQVALSNQWVTRDSKLWQRLNQLVELRSSGESITVAASTAGVSMQLVEKLMLLGGLVRLSPLPQRDNPPTVTTTAETE
ncbi:MAG: hypothetical protein PUP92_26020 [Rhizonema sp. PD38]|nr:hypothetical protein [Rhizonema sp. PD38]